MRFPAAILALTFLASFPLACSTSGDHGSLASTSASSIPAEGTAYQATLRAPRAARGARALRAPDRLQSLPAPAAVDLTPAPAGAAVDHGGANGQAPGMRLTFSGQKRTMTLDSARPPGAPPRPTGRTEPVSSVTYDPVTRTWTWR